VDLFSDVSDTDVLRNLLAELHDDLPGRLSRFRFLMDVGANLGSQGTIILEATRPPWLMVKPGHLL
jgi:hypothetical protein